MREVEALIVQPGPGVILAVELKRVSTLLNVEDAAGMRRLDPRAPLGLEVVERGSDRVGLLDGPGPPTVLYLGTVLGMETISARELVALPPWLAKLMSPALQPAVLPRGEKVVWLLNLDTLTKV